MKYNIGKRHKDIPSVWDYDRIVFVEQIDAIYRTCFSREEFVDSISNDWIDKFNSIDRKVFNDTFRMIFRKIQDNDISYFKKRPMKSIILWYLVDTLVQLRYSSNKDSTIIKLDDKGRLNINEKILFAMLKMLYGKLDKEKVADKIKFPKWMRYKDTTDLYGDSEIKYARFLNDFRRTIKSNRNILYSNMEYNSIIGQLDALKCSKIWTDQQVFDYCKKSNGGEFKGIFKTVNGIEASSKKLYNKCKTMVIKDWQDITSIEPQKFNDAEVVEKLRKMRINKKSVRRYIRYLALMGTVSHRVGRSIDISSAKEFNTFTYGYRMMRQAAMGFGWIKCTDPTFFRGIKCRSYEIKVLANKEIKIDTDIRLNSIEYEMKFARFENRNLMYKYFGENSKAYLLEKIKLFEAKEDSKDVLYRLRKSSMAYMEKGSPDKYKELETIRTKYNHTRNKKELALDIFIDTYSHYAGDPSKVLTKQNNHDILIA